MVFYKLKYMLKRMIKEMKKRKFNALNVNPCRVPKIKENLFFDFNYNC